MQSTTALSDCSYQWLFPRMNLNLTLQLRYRYCYATRKIYSTINFGGRDKSVLINCRYVIGKPCALRNFCRRRERKTGKSVNIDEAIKIKTCLFHIIETALSPCCKNLDGNSIKWRCNIFRVYTRSLCPFVFLSALSDEVSLDWLCQKLNAPRFRETIVKIKGEKWRLRRRCDRGLPVKDAVILSLSLPLSLSTDRENNL